RGHLNSSILVVNPAPFGILKFSITAVALNWRSNRTGRSSHFFGGVVPVSISRRCKSPAREGGPREEALASVDRDSSQRRELLQKQLMRTVLRISEIQPRRCFGSQRFKIDPALLLKSANCVMWKHRRRARGA